MLNRIDESLFVLWSQKPVAAISKQIVCLTVYVPQKDSSTIVATRKEDPFSAAKCIINKITV